MSELRERLEQSEAIVRRAIEDYQPYAVIAMVSGGTDSMTAFRLAQHLGVHMDAVMHVRTGTGITDTTHFVRHWADGLAMPYLEADAGDTYEQHVLRKGFMGIGQIAHTHAWHLLKATPYRKLVSREFRQGKRGRNILLINGARSSESQNRMFKITEDVQQESDTPNYWVNIIRHWSANDCLEFLDYVGQKRNPVAALLHRSGECMCGTMQSQEERREASYWFPDWGHWIDQLEQRVCQRFEWKWGEKEYADYVREKRGQILLPTFTPMCSSCVLSAVHAGEEGGAAE